VSKGSDDVVTGCSINLG